MVWNFMFERERSFLFCKGHFHWKIVLSIMGNFGGGTSAKTRGNWGACIHVIHCAFWFCLLQVVLYMFIKVCNKQYLIIIKAYPPKPLKRQMLTDIKLTLSNKSCLNELHVKVSYHAQYSNLDFYQGLKFTLDSRPEAQYVVSGQWTRDWTGPWFLSISIE